MPAAIIVTKPVLLTVAIEISELLHVTPLLVAFDGRIETYNCIVSPTSAVFDPLIVTDVTAMFDNEHVTVTLSYFVLSAWDVAVIVTVPSETTVTKPLEDTVATDVFELDHVTALLVALEGRTEAIS